MPSYLTSVEADAIAATLPARLVSSYLGADLATKTAALELATERFDTARRYQGRKYATDGSQTLEFPRVAYESSRPSLGGFNNSSVTVADDVWDWDDATQTAIVPLAVKRAVVYEANSVIKGDREGALAAQHDGIASESVGSVSRTYTGNTNGRELPELCREADRASRSYEFRQGRIA